MENHGGLSVSSHSNVFTRTHQHSHLYLGTSYMIIYVVHMPFRLHWKVELKLYFIHLG